MSDIRSWLIGLFASAAAVSVLYSLMPKGKLQTVARLSGGLILLLALLRPALRWDGKLWESSLRRWQERVEVNTLSLQGAGENRLSSLIAEKAGAYIQEKAEAMALTCHPTVTTELRQGVPFPSTVTLDVSFHGALSQIIAEELDIPRERQYWQEERP